MKQNRKGLNTINIFEDRFEYIQARRFFRLKVTSQFLLDICR